MIRRRWQSSVAVEEKTVLSKEMFWEEANVMFPLLVIVPAERDAGVGGERKGTGDRDVGERLGSGCNEIAVDDGVERVEMPQEINEGGGIDDLTAGTAISQILTTLGVQVAVVPVAEMMPLKLSRGKALEEPAFKLISRSPPSIAWKVP